MRIFTAAAILLLFGSAAQAVEIRVLAPGLVGPGLATMAAAWTAKTGNSVVLVDNAKNTVGKIETMIGAGDASDLVMLPSGEFAAIAGKIKPGSQKSIGKLLFGLAVLAGAPHPDISNVEKFNAALKGKSVGYNDPATGSLAGRMVDALLKRPGYESVKAVPSRPTGGQAVADKKVDMAVAIETEEVQVQGIDIVGPVPDGVGLSLDLTGAVLANSAHPAEAAAFLAYFTGPNGAAILKPTGIVAP